MDCGTTCLRVAANHYGRNFKIRNPSELKRPFQLRQGMMADAEIITQDLTIFQRIIRSLLKMGN